MVEGAKMLDYEGSANEAEAKNCSGKRQNYTAVFIGNNMINPRLTNDEKREPTSSAKPCEKNPQIKIPVEKNYVNDKSVK